MVSAPGVSFAGNISIWHMYLLVTINNFKNRRSNQNGSDDINMENFSLFELFYALARIFQIIKINRWNLKCTINVLINVLFFIKLLFFMVFQ